MTATQVHEDLQEANTWLRQAVENALEMKAAATEIPVSLERIAQTITTIARTPIEGDVNGLKPELAVFRNRMRQLQTLLDGAAAFYCASIARTHAIEGGGGYTQNGSRAQPSAAPQFKVRI